MAELVGLNLAAAGLCVMAAHIPLSASPMLVLILAMTLTFTIRSVYVPSTWQRTLVLSISIGAWITTTAVVVTTMLPEGPTHGPMAQGMLVSTVVWWTFVTLVQTTASRAIYGLRQQVRLAEALGQYTLEEKLRRTTSPRKPSSARDLLLSLEDVHPWSHADARRWWKEHGVEAKAVGGASGGAASSPTLRVDLVDRR
ncbi:MAG: hypothetical protein JRH11_22495 [Deltaproteobacteria bacterium]|nr:hypothetical protein [Deltaproteobacteria bacterium]